MKKTRKTTQVIGEKQETDLKGTIVGFVAPDPEEKSQEQEIQDFRLKKENEKVLAQLSDEEQKAKRKQYEEDEEKIEKAKAELLQSIKVRIPAIEKKFKIVEAPAKKGSVVEKIKQKEIEIKEPKNEKTGPSKEKDDREI